MAKNKINEGSVVTAIAPAGGVVSGGAYKIGDLFGVATVDAAAAAEFAFDTRGNYNLPKAAAITPGPFVKVYWDAANNVVTTTAGGNTLIGVHSGRVAAQAGDATLPVRLGIVA